MIRTISITFNNVTIILVITVFVSLFNTSLIIHWCLLKMVQIFHRTELFVVPLPLDPLLLSVR